MLHELRVRDLGVIEDLTLTFGPGLTAVTGETGAGKTLIVGALQLLAGGRADAALVRGGAHEAVVEARFSRSDDQADDQADDVVLSRAVAARGRSRAYVDGAMATLAGMADRADGLLALHGQHEHYALLTPGAQRRLLDAVAGIATEPLREARARVRGIEADLAALGGDARERAREIDLLRFQIAELDAAAIGDVDEEAALEVEEESLADATAHREAAATARAALDDEGGAVDRLRAALTAVAGRPPLAALEARLRHAATELDDVVSELRMAEETLQDDPARLAAVRARRQLLRDLQRKYGDTLADVARYREEARSRLIDLESHEERSAALDEALAAARAEETAAALRVGDARRGAAPSLASEIEARLRELAMPGARVEVSVSAGEGSDVTILLGPNPGEPLRPLAKAASGGELARTMLAIRLVALARDGVADAEGESSATLVFDEVDAGIGGEAALAVGRALAALAGRNQVLVVTHLPQVAAFADHQIVVQKEERDGRTLAVAATVEGDARIVELSRMLSGQPSSDSARTHAEELLSVVRAHRAGCA